jgi:hypothetical protein
LLVGLLFGLGVGILGVFFLVKQFFGD